MSHAITCDLAIVHGGHVTGLPVCSCGWAGDPHDVKTPEGRRAYDQQALQHRVAVAAANGCGWLMIAIGLAILGTMIVGSVYLIGLIAGVL